MVSLISGCDVDENILTEVHNNLLTMNSENKNSALNAAFCKALEAGISGLDLNSGLDYSEEDLKTLHDYKLVDDQMVMSKEVAGIILAASNHGDIRNLDDMML